MNNYEHHCVPHCSSCDFMRDKYVIVCVALRAYVRKIVRTLPYTSVLALSTP